MKTLFSKHKWMQLIYGVLLLAAGILIIVFSLKDQSNISEWLSVVVAVTLFIYSAALLFSGVFSLKKKYFDIAFIYAIIFVSIGVVLVSQPEIIGEFIVIFVATLLTAFGVVEIGEATSMIFFKRPVFFIVLFYILGAAFLTLGVLSYVFKENVQQIIYIAIGALLCLTALVEIGFGTYGLFTAIKDNKKMKETVVDAEVSDVPSEDKKDEQAPQIEEKKEEDNAPELTELDHTDRHDNSNPDA